MDKSNSFSKTERMQKILQMIDERGRILVEDVCETFQISKASARRDLDALAENGRITRFHGGAMKKTTHIQEKRISPFINEIPNKLRKKL